MKSFFSAFLIVVMTAGCGVCECVYFRVSTKLLKCGPADTKALDEANPYGSVSGTPELEEPASHNLLQASCDCGYSLQGSDQRCDMDQTVTKSSVFGADDADNSCRRGNTLCRDVCPPRLP